MKWNKKSKARRSRRLIHRLARLESLENRQLLAAEVLQISIENLSPTDGLVHTPFWVATHDGSFDVGSLNEPAAGFGGLEEIAEGGDVSVLQSRFAIEGVGNDGVVTAPGGFSGAPVFEPGEVAVQNLTVDDTQVGRYFSFASMVIPSNDAFVANLDPLAYPVFDSGGNFLGDQTIVIYGDDIYDSGTEVNNPAGGPAFTDDANVSVDENGVIHLHTGLDDFIGENLPIGNALASTFIDQTPIARITISRASNPSAAIDSDAPRALMQSADLNARADFHEIVVVYSDPSGIDVTSIDVQDIRVTSPALTQLDVLSVTTDASFGTAPKTVTATYRVAPASGRFSAIDNGVFSVVLNSEQVNDPLAHSASNQSLGTFSVDAPVRLQVTFESLSPTGGLGQTPVFIGVHSGSFQIAQAGVAASGFGGLEAIAETGDASGLVNRFVTDSGGPNALITAPSGFTGAPVFEPGETSSQFLEISDSQRDRFFSYASMIIPSNDAFIANLNPREFEVFDAFGNFNGNLTFNVYGRDVWDAGTEVNSPTGGAAFSTEGGDAVDENGVIQRHDGLNDFIGTSTPIGSLTAAFHGATALGRFTISLADAPSGPIDNHAPMATLGVADLNASGGATHAVTLIYTDATGVDVASIDVDDIEVVGAFARPLDVVGVNTVVQPGSDGRSVTATYQVASADGEFSTFDNGVYRVNLLDNAVTDTLGNAAEFDNLGSFEVLVPVRLQITIENLSPTGGLAGTPFWIASHDGNFEVARLGANAAQYAGLEELAEEGDVSGLIARFAADSSGFDTVVTAPDGFAGAPVFEPGELASQTLDVFNTDVNRFFSFANMVIPSNDAFVTNLNPHAHELFDHNGVFRGVRTIDLFGRDILDAGTEENSSTGGAAFSTEGGVSVDENGIIRRHEGLDEFIGIGLPTGSELQSSFDPHSPIARITISLANDASQAIDQSGPVADLDAADVTTVGAASHEFTVRYNDPSGIDLTSIGVDNISVTGPLDKNLRVLSAVTSATAGTTPNSVDVTYTVATEDDQFTARNNARYLVRSNDNGVRDTFGHDVNEGVIGNFDVMVGIRVQVEIESLSISGGVSQTPFWVGFHDGNFEVARTGVSASQFAGLELLAEEGDAGELVARFASQSDGIDAVITAPGGFAGAPILEPGESAQQILEITDSNRNQYFSFASMVIPSNDAFIANLDPRQFQLFDSNGNFQGDRQFTIYGRDVLDAGTEVNNSTGGAAFSTGGGTPTDETNVVRSHSGLGDFVGTGTPNGDLQSSFVDETPIARITITMIDPEASACNGVIGACSVSSVSLQNQPLAFDVNNDGEVSPLDALLVINYLDRFGVTDSIAEEARGLDLFLDVGGDLQISPIDALLVINRLDRESTSRQGEFVAQSASAVAVAQDEAINQLFADDDDENLGVDTAAGLF